MRTSKEIQEAIAKLKEMKPNVRKITAFGDNNHEAIEAQIWVLENEADEDEIDNEFGSEYEREYALYALDWLNGLELDGGGLVEGWQELVTN